jgi:hypothetical protein
MVALNVCVCLHRAMDLIFRVKRLYFPLKMILLCGKW